MHIFYSTDLSDNIFTFTGQESFHLSRVLRLKPGSVIRVINNSGSLYECSVTVASSKDSRARIIREFTDWGKRNYRLHIAIAPTKSNDRFEMFVEKSVEIGIDEITPILCDNSERTRINMDRINKIVIAAMKQSIKCRPTRINPLISFDRFLEDHDSGYRVIASCEDTLEKESLKSSYKAGEDAIIMIGPEGDFSDTEIKRALGTGFDAVHLGPERLRTETAGITACCTVYIANQ